MKTIAIDVDLTTLASDVLWWEWLVKMCGESNLGFSSLEQLHIWATTTNQKVDYDLTEYFGEPINDRVSALDFFRSDSTYDLVQPVEGAVEYISKLASEGFEIVFVTHCKRNHSRSKYNCLERYFKGFDWDYVVTKEKHRVNADIIIDDRNEFLQQFLDKGKTAIRIHTPYTQHTDVDEEHMLFKECEDWKAVYSHIKQSIPF